MFSSSKDMVVNNFPNFVGRACTHARRERPELACFVRFQLSYLI